MIKLEIVKGAVPWFLNMQDQHRGEAGTRSRRWKATTE